MTETKVELGRRVAKATGATIGYQKDGWFWTDAKNRDSVSFGPYPAEDDIYRFFAGTPRGLRMKAALRPKKKSHHRGSESKGED